MSLGVGSLQSSYEPSHPFLRCLFKLQVSRDCVSENKRVDTVNMREDLHMKVRNCRLRGPIGLQEPQIKRFIPEPPDHQCQPIGSLRVEEICNPRAQTSTGGASFHSCRFATCISVKSELKCRTHQLQHRPQVFLKPMHPQGTGDHGLSTREALRQKRRTVLLSNFWMPSSHDSRHHGSPWVRWDSTCKYMLHERFN